MGMRRILIASWIACCALAAGAWGQTISGGTCAPADLGGIYTLSLTGRAISGAGSFAGSWQGVGTATFDGVGKVTLTGTSNSNLAANKGFTYAGTYTMPSNCYGTMVLTQGITATFALIDYGSGNTFGITGADATYVYSGSGGGTIPACGTPTLSGGYSFDAMGFILSGTAQTGAGDESGLLQFDGKGVVTASYVETLGTTSTSLTGTGSYTLGSNCLGSATWTDSAGKANTANFVISGAYGQNATMVLANSGFVRAGAAHSSLTNPGESIGNVASYAVNSTPPGSVFVLFGVNLATRAASALNLPLPTTLLSTSVTVNGEDAPLFYADTGQIDAQMPWDIPGDTVASVVVKNGSAVSNAAAVYVPATGTPGISVYGNNRAVVVNKDNVTVNTPAAPAAVGDNVVVYFTGGGPVQAAGKLVSGAASPSGLSPVTGTNSVTIGGVSAKVVYMGLTPGSIGLYQANIVVPQLSAGSYPVVITIAGQDSNGPVMNVK
jgi:uncharacterized protein (TIGR03437 family)